MNNSYNLDRFIKAQDRVYQQVITELSNGRKTGHWMWYIFPQLEKLGRSPTALFYGIKNLEEAQADLEHPVLGARLIECCQILLDVEEKSVARIFGVPDNKKLKSSMTLFKAVPNRSPVLEQVLTKFFDSEQDDKTLSLINMNG